MHIDINSSNIKFFQALSSETRINILEVLRNGDKNIGELASILKVSSAIMTRHVSALEQVGLLKTVNLKGIRGIQKICSIIEEDIILHYSKSSSSIYRAAQAVKKFETLSIPIGQYTNYEVNPTCGLASTERLIGICDDPRYFSTPERNNASILWFQSGFVEYSIPGYLISSRQITQLEISLELCSEFPDFNENWPSDIYFSLNNIHIGTWTCPGDFGDKKGVFTPEWWRMGTQYGVLKRISVNNESSRLDGALLSNITLKDIDIEPNKDLILKIGCPKNSAHAGGINLFGKGFGNYNQDIEVRVQWE